MSAPPPNMETRSLTVGAIALTDLIRAGFDSFLRECDVQISLVVDQPVDVGLVDPHLVPDGWREPLDRPVVAVLRDHSPSSTTKAERIGARAWIGPDSSAANIITAIQTAHRARPRTNFNSVALSEREAEVLTLICRGLTNIEIASRLFLSINSIKTYIRTAYAKIGVETRSQAILWVHDHWVCAQRRQRPVGLTPARAETTDLAPAWRQTHRSSGA